MSEERRRQNFKKHHKETASSKRKGPKIPKNQPYKRRKSSGRLDPRDFLGDD